MSNFFFFFEDTPINNPVNNTDSIALNELNIVGKTIGINKGVTKAPVIPAAIDVVAIIPTEVIFLSYGPAF